MTLKAQNTKLHFMGLAGAAAIGIFNFGNVDITKLDPLNGGHVLHLVFMCHVSCTVCLRANIIRHHQPSSPRRLTRLTRKRLM